VKHFCTLRRHESFRLFAGLIWILLQTALLGAQPEEYNHPELHWMVHETAHFRIFYHDGAERTARELASIAEEIYDPITSLYDYYPDSKTSVIVRDHDDYSNGGAYYYDNKIVIWATALDFALRGTHNWLHNVMTHEFTHLIQLGASRKGPRWLPAFYIQWIEYEKEKRPDVLYGYPNILASYPLPLTVIPPWFAEGASQTQRPGLGYEHWDSHRDMLLRMRVLEGRLLTYTEMGYYGKTSLDAESVYNQGFSLVQYIIQQWGPSALQDLSNEMRSPLAWSFDYAIKRRLQISGKELYARWSDHLRREYDQRTELIRRNPVSGEIIQEDGFANLHPRWSPDGASIAYISNPDADYFFLSGLYLYDVRKKTHTQLTGGVGSQLAWSPDGRFIFFHKQFNPDRKRSRFDDLAAWDRTTEKVLRLTHSRRASQVDLSPDGKRLCYVVNSDGTENLWIGELNDAWWEKPTSERLGNEIALTHFSNGEQVHTPKWSPDGERILFAFNRDRERTILLYDLRDGSSRTVIATGADSRDPAWCNSDEFYFASDQTGIFNLYRFNLQNGASIPVTNVLGGAFMPDISAEGRIAYSEYHATGYKLALLDSVLSVPSDRMVYLADYPDKLPEVTYSDEPAPELPSKSYKPSFDKTFIFPRLAMDYGTFKPGLYFYFQDILEQLSAFGGFAMNTKRDYDLFALLDYKRLHPTLFLEAYNLVRHTRQTFEDPTKIIGETGSGSSAVPIYEKYTIDYSFNLLEVDAGARIKLRDEIGLRIAGIVSRYRTNLTLDDGTVFGYAYFKGKAVELALTADYRAPGRDQDIAPTGGFFLQVKGAREFNDFIEGFEINAEKGTLQEVYTPYRYNRIQLVADKYLAAPFHPHHSLTLTADLGFLDKPVDSFFHLYAGGLDGMKGYSYYSMGGTRKAILRGVYAFPLRRDIAAQIGFLSLDKIYLQGFADIGNAWEGNLRVADLKKDAGAGLKVQFFSFTTFPTALSFDAAYGFDQFTVVDENGEHKYGAEWRYYFTLLFNFNLRHSFNGTAARFR
jgi:Tol biopolymer transport system component